jgi:uncharacterized integral membrane protein
MLLRVAFQRQKEVLWRAILILSSEGKALKNPKVIAGLVIGVLFLIFLFQNMETVTLHLYFWQISMPKIILIPLAILVGFVAGFAVAKLTGKPPKAKIERNQPAPSPSDSGPSSQGAAR